MGGTGATWFVSVGYIDRGGGGRLVLGKLLGGTGGKTFWLQLWWVESGTFHPRLSYPPTRDDWAGGCGGGGTVAWWNELFLSWAIKCWRGGGGTEGGSGCRYKGISFGGGWKR